MGAWSFVMLLRWLALRAIVSHLILEFRVEQHAAPRAAQPLAEPLHPFRTFVMAQHSAIVYITPGPLIRLAS